MEFRYSLPEPVTGELVALVADEAERVLLRNLKESAHDRKESLWQLARFYSHTRQHEKALAYLRQVMELQPDTEHKAQCILAMGQTMEQVGDYESAVRYYREAFALEPIHTRTWYFIHNNLGFSLNQLGQFAEGERYCRAAIAIDPTRSNGFKNLGLALRGQQRLADAARCFVQATQANASDARSLKLLEELLAEHPELGFADELECCRKAVEVAQQRGAALEPIVYRGWRKQLILARQRIASWFRPQVPQGR